MYIYIDIRTECVCVCERERETERDRWGSDREGSLGIAGLVEDVVIAREVERWPLVPRHAQLRVVI